MGRTKQQFPQIDNKDAESTGSPSETPKTKKKRLHEEDPQAFTGDERRKVQKAKNSFNWRKNQKTSLSSLKKQLVLVNEKNGSLKKEMNTLRRENFYLKEKHSTQIKTEHEESSQKELVLKTTNFSPLSDNFTPLLQDYASMKEENAVLRDRNSSLEAENNALNEKAKSLQQEVSFLKGEENYELYLSYVSAEDRSDPAEISTGLENSRACSSGTCTQLMECSNSAETGAKLSTMPIPNVETAHPDASQMSIQEMTDSDVQQAPIPYMDQTYPNVPPAWFEEENEEIRTTFLSQPIDERTFLTHGDDGDIMLCDIGDMETDPDDSDSE